MAIVLGESVLLSFWDGSEFVPFACTRSITINLSSELIGKSTVGSGDWKEKEVTALDWNFNFEGITYLNESGYYDLSNMIDLWINKTLIQVKFFLSDGTTDLALTGDALIVSVSPTGSVNNVASVSVSGEGTGELSTSTTIIGLNYIIDSDGENIIDNDSEIIEDN